MFVTVKVFAVFRIVVVVAKLSEEDSHLTTFPVLPLSINTVLLVPAQTVVLPETEPPTDVGLTVTVAEALGADGQTPLCTTAR